MDFLGKMHRKHAMIMVNWWNLQFVKDQGSQIKNKWAALETQCYQRWDVLSIANYRKLKYRIEETKANMSYSWHNGIGWPAFKG